MAVAPEGPGPPVVAVEAAVAGADPEDAVTVLVKRPDAVVAQAAGIPRAAAQHFEAVAVVAVESVVGTDPQEPQAVL